MKKVLLFAALALALPAVSRADDVTFDFTQDTYGAGPAYSGSNTAYVTTNNVATQSPVSVTLTGTSQAWRFWSDGLRVYRNQSAKFTVSVSSGYVVTNVSWTWATTAGTFKVEGESSNITNWTGSEESVTFEYTATGGNYPIKTLTVTYAASDPGKTPAGLEFPQSSYTANYYDGFTAPELTNPYGLTVTYESSEPSVATVNANTGEVTLVGGGSTVISVTSEATDNYAEGYAQYVLDVEKPLDPSIKIQNATIVWANAGYSDGESVNTYNGVSPITVICNKGTNENNDPKYYNGGEAVRMYNGNTMTIELAEGYILESIEFTTVSGNPFNPTNTIVSNGTFVVGNPATTTTWTATGTPGAVTITHNSGTQLRIVTMSINYYTENSDVKYPAGLSYSQSNCVVIYNDEGDYTDLLPVLSYETNADIKYTSSNTAVATVDDEGGVIIVGTGTTTITAEAPENDDYLSDTASYELTVLEPITAGYNLDIIWNEVNAEIEMEGNAISSYTDETTGIEFEFALGEGANAPIYMASTGTINLYTGNTMTVTVNNSDAELLGMEFVNATSFNFNGTTADRGSMTIAPEYARWEPTVVTARAASEGSNTVTFTFAGNTRILMTSVYYDIETGVNTIEAADYAEAVYFNLQGVKVQNPEHGIYVKVVNGKATKVVL